jgi:hypothetical protein
MNGWPTEYLYGRAAIVGIFAISRCEGDHALLGIGDVGAVVVEGAERADHAAHHRHRMGVTRRKPR